MSAVAQSQDWPTRCVPHRGSFLLQAKVQSGDAGQGALWISIEAEELLRWMEVAAEYSAAFRQQLQQRLTTIQPED